MADKNKDTLCLQMQAALDAILDRDHIDFVHHVASTTPEKNGTGRAEQHQTMTAECTTTMLPGS